MLGFGRLQRETFQHKDKSTIPMSAPKISETFPLSQPAKVHRNLREAELIEMAIKRGEGRLASTGAFVARTGVHTGRSPNDKFTIRDADTEKTIWWDNNKSITRVQFDTCCCRISSRT